MGVRGKKEHLFFFFFEMCAFIKVWKGDGDRNKTNTLDHETLFTRVGSRKHVSTVAVAN